MDHIVNTVGYANSNGTDYYIVRNSWGAGWGDKGYIKIAAEDGNSICGMHLRSQIVSTN